MSPPSRVSLCCIPSRDLQEWVRALQAELEEEAARFGSVIHLSVARDSPGNVYVMFAEVGPAVAAATAFNGQAFTSFTGLVRSAAPGAAAAAGRLIGVDFVPLADYTSRFPQVRSRV